MKKSIRTATPKKAKRLKLRVIRTNVRAGMRLAGKRFGGRF